MGNSRSTRNSATKTLTLPLEKKGAVSPVGYSKITKEACQPFLDWAIKVEGEYEVSDASELLGYRRMYHLAMYLIKNHKTHAQTQLVVDRVWEILTALLGRKLTAEKRATYTRHITNIEKAERGEFDWEASTKSKGKKSKVSRRRSQDAPSQDASKTETTRRKKTEVPPKTEAPKTEAPPQGNHDGDVQKSNTLDRILALLEAGKISEALANRMMDKAEAESE